MKKLYIVIFILLTLINNAVSSEISLTLENDILFRTDKYYTHGTLISYSYHYFKEFLNLNIIAARHSIGQYIYTPSDISEFELIEDDRPYAGLLYIDNTILTKYKNSIYTYGFLIGVIGEHSFAEEIQTKFHDIINVQNPNGWDNQLNNEIVVNLSLFKRDLYVFENVEAIFYYGGSIGNLNTQLNVGGILRSKNVWSDYDLLTIEPFPKYYMEQVKKIKLGLFVGLEGSLVGYNVTLDGNMFSDSHSVDKKPFIMELFGGFNLSYDNYRLIFSSHIRTKEFEGQKRKFQFSSLSIAYLF